jgi:hypothetical protein
VKLNYPGGTALQLITKEWMKTEGNSAKGDLIKTIAKLVDEGRLSKFVGIIMFLNIEVHFLE